MFGFTKEFECFKEVLVMSYLDPRYCILGLGTPLIKNGDKSHLVELSRGAQFE